MKYKRVYISADIEGVAGVVGPDQAFPPGFEYQLGRRWMTDEVIAACNAAFSHGAEEIIVADSHGNGQNIFVDDLPDKVRLARSAPRPLDMMEGIDIGKFDAAIFIGYHNGSTDIGGSMSHTVHGLLIHELRINGKVASESVLSAAIAGHFNVPVIFSSGDDAYIESVLNDLGNIETVINTWSTGQLSAVTMKPSESCLLIERGVTNALANLESYPTYNVTGPVEIEMTLKKRVNAELLSYLPIIERLNAYDIRIVVKDMVEASKVITFIWSVMQS